MLLRRSSHTRGSFTQLRTLWSPTTSPSLTHLPETSLNAQASQFRTLFTHRASHFRNGHSSIPLFITSDQSHRGFHTTCSVRSSDSKTTREAATEESRTSTTRHLFRFLKETAEAGDKEAQFKVGCMLCLGEAAMRASLGLSEADADADEESAALIQLEQLDYILGDDGVVIPKDRDAFESTKIANWKQWLKREREKLKNRNSAQQDTSEKEDSIALDYTEAAKWFAHSAQQNHPFAQYFLGTFYLKGLGVEYDVNTALELFNKSAQQGNSLSFYELGQLYYEGSKVPLDVVKSREYFAKAVELGNANAMYWLGYCYHEGIDCEPSIEKTLELLERAADMKHPGAIFYLAMLYRNGVGAPIDYEKMMRYLKKGVEVEDTQCMRCLADIYYHGTDGVEVDYPLALQYYHQAGLRGDPDALCCEGVMHFKGEGTPQDYSRAFYAYQASALKDNPAACRNLAYLFKHGLGCAQSDVNSAHYLGRAEDIVRKQYEAQLLHHHHHHHEGCNHDHDHDDEHSCEHHHHHH